MASDTVSLINGTTSAPFVVDDMQLQADAAAAGPWEFVSLSPETAQVALDAVRYQSNYARTVTTRLCLHYINTIRMRVSSSSITSYLVSVDGCKLSQVDPTGRCDIYYCRPYTYEVQLEQKAVGSTVFIVKSIYKTIDQKSLNDFREEASNLDFTTAFAEAAVAEKESIFYPKKVSLQTTQPVAAIEEKPGSPTTEKEPDAWTSDLNGFRESEPIPTPQSTAPPLLIRVETLSTTVLQGERATTAGPSTVIAIIGIAAVSVSMVAFVVALAMVRWRVRANNSKFVLSQEYSPLSGIPSTMDNTISISSTETVASDTIPDIAQLTGFFI